MVHIATTPIRHNGNVFNIGDVLKEVEQEALDRLVQVGAAKILDVESQILAPIDPAAQQPAAQTAAKQAAPAPAQTAAPAPAAKPQAAEVAEEKPIAGINPELVPTGEKK